MITKKYITYAGIEAPKTLKELQIEILGLKNSIAIANELISRYEQVIAIVNFEEKTNESQAKRPTEASQDKGAEQEARKPAESTKEPE